MEKTMIQKAIEFATSSHEGQYRKNGKVPYVAHVIEVMKEVGKVTDDEEILCAAVLHDYIEDCDEMLSYAEKYRVLVEMFNQNVADMVMDCTQDPIVQATLLHPRVVKYNHIKSSFGVEGTASKEAKLIKLMDRFCNVKDFFSERKKEDDNYYSIYSAQAIPLYLSFVDDERQMVRNYVEILHHAATFAFDEGKYLNDYTEEEIIEALTK